MNRAVARYKRELKKNLTGRSAIRRNLMAQFDGLLNAFLGEHPDPSAEELHAAFGSPTEMSAAFTATLSAEEVKRYSRRKLFARFFVIGTVIFLIIFSIYAICIKEYGINVIDKTIVYSEQDSTKPTP